MTEIRNGQPFVILTFLASLLIVGILLAVISPQLAKFYNDNHNDTSVMNEDAQLFFRRSKTIWLWAPVVVAVGFILRVIIKANEKGDRY